MSEVYIFEPTKLDISGLYGFGEVVILFPEGDSRRPLRDQKLEEQIISALIRKEFNPEEDYIALVGSTLTMAILLTAVVAVFGQARCLVFENATQSYFERSMGHLIDQEVLEIT